MRKTIKIVNAKGQRINKEINNIPIRYIIAIVLLIIELVLVIGTFIYLIEYIPYFHYFGLLLECAVFISIVSSNDNPDYKIPWLIFVLILPVVGCMLYLIFYKRKLSKRFINKIVEEAKVYKCDDNGVLEKVKKENIEIYNHSKQLKHIAHTHIYNKTSVRYYNVGYDMYIDMLSELKKAESFIFIEYFIIEQGIFWNEILKILEEKVKEGVEVRVIYDDIGCMLTLPGNYYKQLRKKGIDAIPFGFLRGHANSGFNNRNHRKIMIIDGKVGFTGGVNIADEYINKKARFGYWKDTAVKLNGDGVNELTNLFLLDYAMSVNEVKKDSNKYYIDYKNEEGNGYVIPFGDGPNPIYKRQVSKTMIMNMLYNAEKYVYITTPYLIVDNELASAIENTALRGVDVRIIVPHIPDKKIVFGMTRSSYKRFIDNGVKIYEYEPGFIHAKSYVSDDNVAIVGTVNLDYRSLVHHFENGVWMYNTKCIEEIKKDIIDSINLSIEIKKDSIRNTYLQRLFRSIVKIFSPLL